MLSATLSGNVKFPVTEQRFPISGQRFPVSDLPLKYPVTQEDMATHVGKGLPVRHPAQGFFIDELHTSVNALVHNLAAKYVDTCPGEDIEDLAQECWYRIIYKLHTYERRKGAFTTWCWRVCSSVLNKGYRRNKRRTDPLQDMPEYFEAEDESCNEEYGFERDIRETVEELTALHPEHTHVLKVMFGKSGELPSRVNLTAVARKCGVDVSQVSRLYHDIVQPFFVERFKGGIKNG